MPLKPSSSKKNIAFNFRELKKDNQRKGRTRGANGKKRSRAQMIAIALNVKKKKKK